MAGVDDLFNEKMRVVVEYMQYRELSSDIKRKVGWDEYEAILKSCCRKQGPGVQR